MSKHLVLLGDSVFDNALYTGDGPDVTSHLRMELPSSWSVTKLAKDGSTTTDISSQLMRLPPSISNIVVSVGGNDVLAEIDALSQPVSSIGHALIELDFRAAIFEDKYRDVMRAIKVLYPKFAICTIYNGDLPIAIRASALAALKLFNDAIIRVAIELDLDVIDLRFVCAEPTDYVGHIEPSESGGRRIALAIVNSLELTGSPIAKTSIHAGDPRSVRTSSR